MTPSTTLQAPVFTYTYKPIHPSKETFTTEVSILLDSQEINLTPKYSVSVHAKEYTFSVEDQVYYMTTNYDIVYNLSPPKTAEMVLKFACNTVWVSEEDLRIY